MTSLHLDQYHIDAEIGRGGMGIVYRATDTKLGRTVALKILPAAALSSADDRARFFREAQAAAQLSHPNIAGVHQIDEAIPVDDDGNEVGASDGPRPYIAMEFIDGETVAERVKRGPLALREAVAIAGQVAEALKAAHAKDIVHRDIKSANVMLTADGVAKVLDFGLAKTNQSTMLTRMGSTLGTVAYMSPEQARGQEVDGRTDLYSLGTMLYEMVAGRLPFAGDYEQAVVYSILNETPEPLTALRTGIPMELERITNKLLSKEAEYRYQTAADLIADFKALDVSDSGVSRRHLSAVGSSTMPATSSTSPRGLIPMLGIGLAALLIGGTLGAWLLGGVGGEQTEEPAQFTIELPNAQFPLMAAWMPDGSAFFYSTRQDSEAEGNVERYDIATGAASRILGTEGYLVMAVSPDGRWLLLYDQDSDLYKKVLSQGGTPSVIPGSDTTSPAGAVLRNDGTVYFITNNGAIARVSANGEREIVADNAGTGHFFVLPFMPENTEDVYWAAGTTPNEPFAGGYLKPEEDSLRLAFPQFVVAGMFQNGYALLMPNGFPVGEPLLVAPFDLRDAALLGNPVPFEPVARMALSNRGHLLYQEFQGVAPTSTEVTRVRDPDGQVVETPSVPGQRGEIATAWSRRATVVTSVVGENRRDLYVVDLESGTQTRLTRDGDNIAPSWSADDEYVYFGRSPSPDEPSHIARRRIDGVGDIEMVYADSTGPTNPAVSPDGKSLVFGSRKAPAIGWDTWIMDFETGNTRILAGGEGAQSDASFSPDGRYVVYRSTLQGDLSVVVTPVEGEGDIEVTSDGNDPVWSRDGRFIYFEREGGRQIVRIPVTTDPIFRIAGAEEVVYEIPQPLHLHFDLLSDGSIVTSEMVNGSSDIVEDPKIRVVLNFDVLAERLAPRN